MSTCLENIDTVPEGSGIGYQIDFTDDDGDPVIPNNASIFWSLYDDAGEIVNSRLNVAVTPEAATIYIVTTGEDNIVKGNRKERHLRVKSQYDSTNLGNDVDNIQVRDYVIIDAVGVTT